MRLQTKFLLLSAPLVLFAFCQLAIAQGEEPGRETSKPKEQPKTSSAKDRKRNTSTSSAPSQPRVQPRSRTPAMASLHITSMPSGSTVLLDGTVYGTASNDGSFYVPSLKPGQHTVRVHKDGFREESRTITLSNRENGSLGISLTPLPGILNVTTNVEGAQIEIQGQGTFTNRIDSLPLTPGWYQFTVSKSGYVKIARQEYVGPGELKTLPFFLERVPIDKILQLAEAEYRVRSYKEAVNHCREVLAIEPTNARANLLIGLSFLAVKDFGTSLNYLVRAVSLGDSLKLIVGRRRSSLLDESLEFGHLEFTNSTITFYNTKLSVYVPDSTRGDVDFSVPYNKIVESKAGQYLGVWRLFMKVAIPKKGNKEDKKNFDFYMPSASIRLVTPQGSTNGYTKIYCDNCQSEVQFIYNLLAQLTQGSQSSRETPKLKRRVDSSDSVAVALPSSTYHTFTGSSFQIELPNNWQAFGQTDNYAMFAGDGGYNKIGERYDLYHGIQVGFVDSSINNLSQTMEGFVSGIVKINPYLAKQGGLQSTLLGGREAILANLSGVSNTTNQNEIIQVYLTSFSGNKFFYLITATSPEKKSDFEKAFERIRTTVRLVR